MKRLQVNTRERAVSTDVNRLQQFASSDFEEMLRLMLDGQATEEAAMGDATLGTNVGTPLRATVINGLLVRPELATTNVIVDPGVVGMVSPLGTDNADDSPFKVVRDAGIPNGVPTLQLTANLSAGTRFDVVECAFTQAAVEFDSRDIFNPVSGLFLPGSVAKVVLDSLTYRIRSGAIGGGFPGTVNGWLPLMVAKVPAGALNWDACTMWDVRPLASERRRQPFAGSTASPSMGTRQWAFWNNPSSDMQLQGWIEAVGPQGYVLGGDLAQRSPYLSLLGAEVTEPGFAIIDGQPWYLYLCEPFGLPRWARYTDAANGARRPATPRGIPVLTQTKVPTVVGLPQSPIAMPNEIGGSTQSAKCVLAGMMSDSGNMFPGTLVDGLAQWHQDTHDRVPTVTKPSQQEIVFTYTLVPGADFPPNAQVLKLRFFASWEQATALTQNFTRLLHAQVSGTDVYWTQKDQYANNTGASQNATLEEFTVEVPMPPWGGPVTLTLDYSWVPGPIITPGAINVVSGPQWEVIGWRLF